MTTTLGVIGFGRMGYRTALAGRMAGMEIVSILDSSLSPWGGEQDGALADLLVQSLDEFLGTRPDLVSISTTADSHAALFQAAAKSGIKNILVEKPVACSINDVLDMEVLAQQLGVHAVVNHHNRSWGELQKIRNLSGSERYGDLKSLIVTQGAGGFGNLGTHYFDMANWFFNSAPLKVSAFGTTPEAVNPRGQQFKDIGGCAIVQYSRNRRFILEIGDDVGVIGGYEFRFEYGRVVMPFVSEPPQAYRRKQDALDLPKHFYGAPLEFQNWEEFAPPDVVKHTKNALLDAKNGTFEHCVSLADARIALEVMVAARLAIENQAVILLPLRGDNVKRRYSLA